MPAWARSVTCRLYPHPVDDAVAITTEEEPCTWMCREQVQRYDNFTRKVVANIDTTCSETVICAINVRGFVMDNPHCERIRLDVEVDKNPADSYIYNARDLRAAGHELLTDDIRIPLQLGQIRIHFEAWGPDYICDPRRVDFVLHYYKDDENMDPKERFIQSTRPPLQGYEFRQRRQKYKTLNDSATRRVGQETRKGPALELDKREDGKEEGEICEETIKDDALRRSYRRRQERLAERARPEAEENDRRRRRQRSVSRERREDRWEREKRSATPTSRCKHDSKSAAYTRRERSPPGTSKTSDKRAPKDKIAPKSAIDSIKHANKQLTLEIEQLRLLKAQKQLKKELQKLKEEISQPEKVPAPLRLTRSSSLSIVSEAATSQHYEPLSPASFLDDVSRSCHSGQADGYFNLKLRDGVPPYSPRVIIDSHKPMSASFQQPRDNIKPISTNLHDVSISEADLDNLRSIRQQLYSNRQKQSIS